MDNNLIYTIYGNETIYNALKKLSTVTDVSKLILFVIDNKRKVIGSLTDGDIRRSLIINKNLNERTEKICNKNFKYILNSTKFVDLNKLKKKNQSVKIIPVLDSKKELVDIIDLSKVKSILPVDAFIMAGGRGKRLSPLTDKCPKPMLEIAGKPIIEHIIDNLISYGVKNIYISLNYKGEIIKEYFGDGSKKKINIYYLNENIPLGTAGSLSLVKEFENDKFILINGDLFTNINFEKMFLEMEDKKSKMVVATKDYRVDVPYAILETNMNKVVSFREKPTYTFNSNAGIYMLESSLIEKIPKEKFFDITDLMDHLIQENIKLINVPISGYWFDIGRPDDYYKVCEFVKHFNF